MRVKDLIKQLQEVENKDKFIHLLGNSENPEVWDDGSESITLFLNSYPTNINPKNK